MSGPPVDKSPAHKIATQHRLIESLFDGLGSALSARDGERAQLRSAGLRRALDAHFVLEEEHYFPRMRDERPDLEPDLQRFGEEHVIMRSHAEHISAHLGLAQWEPAKRTFDALRALFQRHETFELDMVDS